MYCAHTGSWAAFLLFWDAGPAESAALDLQEGRDELRASLPYFILMVSLQYEQLKPPLFSCSPAHLKQIWENEEGLYLELHARTSH